MKKTLISFLLILSACTKDYNDLEIFPIVETGPLLSVNYNIPSHDYKHHHQPWVDFGNIISDFNYNTRAHTNTSLSIADFNGDGYGDLYFHNNFIGVDEQPVDPIFMTFNTTTSTYNLDNDITFVNNLTVIHSRKTITGDFNLDGKPDVVRAAGAHDILSKSNITLSTDYGYELQYLSSVPESQYHTLSSGDIDGDGDLDIFFGGTYEDGFGINNGDGTFSWKRSYEIVDNFKVLNSVDGNHGKYGLWTSEITDVNNDGLVDLIFAGIHNVGDPTHLNGITIIYNDNYSFDYNDAEIVYIPDGHLTEDLAVIDFNNDNLPDLITKSVISQNRNIVTAHIQTENGFEPVEVEGGIFPELPGFTWITVRDVDNDGKVEIVEQESSIFQYTGTIRRSLQWEYSGNKFIK